MDVILLPVKWQFALIYLNDIIVFLRSSRDHIEHVLRVLSLLWGAGVTLILKKCNCFTRTLDFLGHVIQPRRLKITTHPKDARKGLKPPSDITELQSFLGLYNLLCCFGPIFARVADPFMQKLKKGPP